jgi:hypothetical protein
MPASFDGDAHAFLQVLYRDETKPVELRLDAAKAAIRYEKPALASVQASGKDGGPIVVEIIEFVIPPDKNSEQLGTATLSDPGLARLERRSETTTAGVAPPSRQG